MADVLTGKGSPDSADLTEALVSAVLPKTWDEGAAEHLVEFAQFAPEVPGCVLPPHGDNVNVAIGIASAFGEAHGAANSAELDLVLTDILGSPLFPGEPSSLVARQGIGAAVAGGVTGDSIVDMPAFDLVSPHVKVQRLAASIPNAANVGATGPLPSAMADQPSRIDETLNLATFRFKKMFGRSHSAEALFWPKGRPMAQQKLQEVFSKAWKLDPPNLVVYLEAGAAHPTDLATEQLIDMPQFKDWCQTARLQANLGRARQAAGTGLAAEDPAPSADRPGSRGWPHAPVSMHAVPELIPAPSAANGGEAAESSTADLCGVISGMLFEKMKMIFAAILDAAALTNNWIVIDRTRGSSASAELLIEMALSQSSSSPIILVVEKRSRLQQFVSREAQEQLQQIQRIQAEAVMHGTDVQRLRVDIDPLYSLSEFQNDTHFRGADYTSIPLPTMPMAEHITENGQAYSVAGTPDRVMIGKKRVWMYHYTQFLFSSGTHYVFLEDADQTLPLESLGPTGAVFAHGGTAACARLRDWLQHGKPTVMLFNSGGCTQAFASLHNAVVRRHVHNMKQTLKEVQIVSKEQWARNFGISEIMMMQELNMRAPVVSRKAIVSVDILQDTADSVLQVVTGCFAAATGGLPELGLRSAETDVVYRAWRQHETLLLNANHHLRRANYFFYASMLLASLISIFAAVHPMIDDDGDTAQTAVEYTVIVLPLLSGIVATVASRTRALEKWGVLRAGAFRMVAEIYKFRARVLEYDVNAPTPSFGDSADEEDGQPKRNSAHTARTQFVARVQAIFSNVLDGDMNSDALIFQ